VEVVNRVSGPGGTKGSVLYPILIGAMNPSIGDRPGSGSDACGGGETPDCMGPARQVNPLLHGLMFSLKDTAIPDECYFATAAFWISETAAAKAWPVQLPIQVNWADGIIIVVIASPS
jgi:hypothetical protein